jgi:cytochrome c peroxidase
VNVQRRFGSQRAAYFDGDPVQAQCKGVNILERGSQVHSAEATEGERRGQALFFGKARCRACHPAPYYTDNLMHNLRTERFYAEVMINGRKASQLSAQEKQDVVAFRRAL